jgi:DnaJ-class molecular chaperone
MKNVYQIFGIARTATSDEIKRVYRKLSMKYHPDKNPGNKKSEEIFKEINEANEILSDAGKRQVYDDNLRQEEINSQTFANTIQKENSKTNWAAAVSILIILVVSIVATAIIYSKYKKEKLAEA